MMTIATLPKVATHKIGHMGDYSSAFKQWPSISYNHPNASYLSNQDT